MHVFVFWIILFELQGVVIRAQRIFFFSGTTCTMNWNGLNLSVFPMGENKQKPDNDVHIYNGTCNFVKKNLTVLLEPFMMKCHTNIATLVSFP